MSAFSRHALLTVQPWACADGIPIALRVWKADNFQPGPFSLGSLRLPINLLALAWVAICIVRPGFPSRLPHC